MDTPSTLPRKLNKIELTFLHHLVQFNRKPQYLEHLVLKLGSDAERQKALKHLLNEGYVTGTATKHYAVDGGIAAIAHAALTHKGRAQLEKPPTLTRR